MTFKQSKMWTKDEIRKVVEFWSTKSTSELCEMLNAKEFQLLYVAAKLRKAGVKIPKKHQTGYLDKLVKEVAAELQ